MNEQNVVPVRWGIVVVAAVSALIIGAVAGFVGGAIGIGRSSGYDGQPETIWMVLFGIGTPLVILGVAYAVARLIGPNFAKGWLIGSCFALLLTGFCNIAISTAA